MKKLGLVLLLAGCAAQTSVPLSALHADPWYQCQTPVRAEYCGFGPESDGCIEQLRMEYAHTRASRQWLTRHGCMIE